jgi:hypothetical protein
MTCQGACDLGTEAAMDFRILVFFSFAARTQESVPSVSSPDDDGGDDDEDDDDDDANMRAMVEADNAAIGTAVKTVK